MTQFHLLSSLLGCLWLMSVPEALAKKTNTRQTGQPNIIFILADDYGYNDIGYHSTDIETPVLDSLAQSGVRLENYYVQPICTPTRSQLLTGRYQIHTGLQHSILRDSQPNGLPLQEVTLADKLKEAGYSTNMIGKWHLGFYQAEYQPWYRGFDTFFGFLNGLENYYTHTVDYNSTPYLDYRTQEDPVFTDNGTYSTFTFTNQAIQIIESHSEQDRPFFIYLAYQAPHFPLQVPDEYLQKYMHIQNKKRRIYAGMVSCMDEGIGNITAALQENGLWANTVVIFSNDNGGSARHGGNNYPLRGGTGSLFEGGVRGVGFVSGGAVPASDVINNELIHVSDWFPTLVRLAGGNLNGTLPLDGVDQWETITKSVCSPRDGFLHNIDPLRPLKGERLFNDTWDTRVRAAIRMGDYKLVTGDAGPDQWIPPPREESQVILSSDDPEKNLWLFNIRDDPLELRDLSEEMPDKVRELLDKLVEFNNTAVPCRYPPDDPQSDPALHGGVWGPWQ